MREGFCGEETAGYVFLVWLFWRFYFVRGVSLNVTSDLLTPSWSLEKLKNLCLPVIYIYPTTIIDLPSILSRHLIHLHLQCDIWLLEFFSLIRLRSVLQYFVWKIGLDDLDVMQCGVQTAWASLWFNFCMSSMYRPLSKIWWILLLLAPCSIVKTAIKREWNLPYFIPSIHKNLQANISAWQ